MIKKLQFFVTCTERIADMPDSPEKQKIYKIIVGQVKTFTKHLSEL